MYSSVVLSVGEVLAACGWRQFLVAHIGKAAMESSNQSLITLKDSVHSLLSLYNRPSFNAGTERLRLAHAP